MNLHEAGKRKNGKLHRLVAEAFLGPQPSPEYEVAHKNGIVTDNQVENLRWSTRTENMRDCIAHGTRPQGEANGQSKLTEADVIEARNLYGSDSVTFKELAFKYSVCRPVIFNAVTRNTWKHVA